MAPPPTLLYGGSILDMFSNFMLLQIVCGTPRYNMGKYHFFSFNNQSYPYRSILSYLLGVWRFQEK